VGASAFGLNIDFRLAPSRLRVLRDAYKVDKGLGRLKWNLWHGNVTGAINRMEELDEMLETAAESENQRKLQKMLAEFRRYIESNRAFIPNFGERYRNQECISTAFVESTVNQVISKRMVKHQQMQWSKEGAHLLVQMRTKVLNGQLEGVFRRWYPQFRASSIQAAQVAA
jgi:hypothetical protein